jgi:hypothetical protein
VPAVCRVRKGLLAPPALPDLLAPPAAV